MGQTAVIPAQIVDVAARSLLGNNTASADAAQTISFSAASSGDVLTVQGDGSVAFAAPSGGIGGSTGSTDNAVLRADGTAGDTLQDSGWIIPDIYTSSPNATVNHLSLQATGSSTNVSVSIVPKGAGAFTLAVPDGTTAGGNARGDNAVDLRTAARGAATGVASGTRSFLGPNGGSATNTGSVSFGGTASGLESFSGASPGATASGTKSFAANGDFTTVSGVFAFGCCGDFLTVSGARAFGHGTIPGIGGATVAGQDSFGICGGGTTANGQGALSHGYSAIADRYGMQAHAAGRFSANGDCQAVEFVLRNKTTTDSAVTLLLNGSSARLTIPSGKAMHGMLYVLGAKSDGSAIASYTRQLTIANVGGTTSLVGTVNTIGTDVAAGTSLAVTADDTNDALDVAPTGVLNETWRWYAEFHGIELAYGS
jgi:hypothetical protein